MARSYADHELFEIITPRHRFRMPRAYAGPIPPTDVVRVNTFILHAIRPYAAPTDGENRTVSRAPPIHESAASPAVTIRYRELDYYTRGARSELAREAERLGIALEEFSPASPATLGWHVRLGRPSRGAFYYREPDLFWSELPRRGFVGAACRVGGYDGRRYAPETCVMYADWRGATVSAEFSRVWLVDWQSMALGMLSLLDQAHVEAVADPPPLVPCPIP
jgi:hypothetical protein